MKKIILLLIVILFSSLYSQIIFVPAENSVYEYLSALSIKGIIPFNDDIQPLSRDYIAGRIYELETKKNFLTEIEVQELEFYSKEYFFELKKYRKENPGNV